MGKWPTQRCITAVVESAMFRDGLDVCHERNACENFLSETFWIRFYFNELFHFYEQGWRKCSLPQPQSEFLYILYLWYYIDGLLVARIFTGIAFTFTFTFTLTVLQLTDLKISHLSASFFSKVLSTDIETLQNIPVSRFVSKYNIRFVPCYSSVTIYWFQITVTDYLNFSN
jgi:hypothetical protein